MRFQLWSGRYCEPVLWAYYPWLDQSTSTELNAQCPNPQMNEKTEMDESTLLVFWSIEGLVGPNQG